MGAAVMRTSAGRVSGAALSKGMMRVAGPLWDSGTQYDTNSIVAFAGHTMKANAPTGRGMYPQGIGDGSTPDRDVLMAFRNGFAASVTGGYAGPTYVVTRGDDALDGAGAPVSGTLRYGLCGQYGIDHGGNYWDPLWIVFAPGLGDVVMDQGGVNTPVNPAPNRTIDGRGWTGKILFPRNDAAPLRGIASVGVKSPNNAGTPWFRDGGGYNGIANLIWAYLTVYNANVSSVNCEVFGGSAYSGGPTWYHHVTASGGADGVLDVLAWFAYIVEHPEFGIHVENLIKNVTIDWCQLGPHPTADALIFAYTKRAAPNQGADMVANNQASDGKITLSGVHPQDGYRADNLRITCHHTRFLGGAARNPKVACCRYHLYNCWIDRYGGHIGMEDPTWMVVPTDLSIGVPGGTSKGWSPALLATLDDARHRNWPYPIWDQNRVEHPGFGYGAECSRDGELLAENNVWTGYSAGDDHVLNDDLVARGFITTDQRWKATHPQDSKALNAIVNHANNWPDPLVICRGHLFETSAGFGTSITEIGGVGYSPAPSAFPGGVHGLFRGFRNGQYKLATQDYVNNPGWTWVQDGPVDGDGGGGPDWGGAPTYSYGMFPADSTLKADLQRGAGNVQVWQTIA